MAENPGEGSGIFLFPSPFSRFPMKTRQAILSGLIYRVKRGQVSAYASRPSLYCCAVPIQDFASETWIGDCWLTDEHGNPDPGLDRSPVPVRRDSLGPLIGRAPSA